jgi:aminopeptidase N
LRDVPPVDFGKREITGYAYSVGNLMFFALYRLVGHEAFCRIIGEFYRTYAATAGGTADFIKVAGSNTHVDLTRFFDDWLFSTRWTNIVATASKPADLFARYQLANTR